MTELLTESFCERCGTRYELGTSEPMSRSRKTRGLVTGLRSFIMSTESLSDSISDAMRAEEESLASRQIDAFQETFNFCLDCRRYTCVGCWNEDAGRCRSCMPVAGVDDITGFEERIAHPALMPSLEPEMPLLTTAEEPAWPAEEIPALAWPTQDDVVAPIAAQAALEEPVEVAAEAADMEPLPEPTVVPGFVTLPEPEVVLAAEADAAETAAVEEPVEAERVEEPVEEPIAAAAELEPETPPRAEPPVIPGPRRDLRDTFLRGPVVARPPAGPPDSLPESLAARRSQLDILGIDDPGEGTVSVGQRVDAPYRSSGVGSADASATLAAVWAASSRALETGSQRAAIRPCGACGLTVSATARFCRRCGAPQTLSA